MAESHLGHSVPETKSGRASPAARATARALHVPLERVVGTGPGGSITRLDVEHAAALARAGGRRAALRRAKEEAEAAAGERGHESASERIELTAALDWLERGHEGSEEEVRGTLGALMFKAAARAAESHPIFLAPYGVKVTFGSVERGRHHGGGRVAHAEVTVSGLHEREQGRAFLEELAELIRRPEGL